MDVDVQPAPTIVSQNTNTNGAVMPDFTVSPAPTSAVPVFNGFTTEDTLPKMKVKRKQLSHKAALRKKLKTSRAIAFGDKKDSKAIKQIDKIALVRKLKAEY